MKEWLTASLGILLVLSVSVGLLVVIGCAQGSLVKIEYGEKTILTCNECPALKITFEEPK